MGKMIIGDVEVRKLRYLGDMSFMHIEKSFRVMSGLVWERDTELVAKLDFNG